MKKISPCKICGKETYNQTSDWAWYCSQQCERIGIEKVKADIHHLALKTDDLSFKRFGSYERRKGVSACCYAKVRRTLTIKEEDEWLDFCSSCGKCLEGEGMIIGEDL